MPMTRRAALAAGAAATAMSAVPASGKHRPAGAQPNIIHICTDDMRLSDLVYMRTVKTILKARGINFTHHYTVFPVCAPSRVSMLTGLQAHNHNVLDNDGAYAAYQPLEANSIAPWLQAAGYYTGHVGKFINDYLRTDHVPPGYDFWRAIAGSFEVYYNFYLNEDGTIVRYKAGQYITDVLNQKVQDFLAAVPAGQPFALWYWPNACHGPEIPADQDMGTIDPNTMPLPPSFNVNIVNGKKNPELTPDEIADLKNQWALRLETLQSVDRGIAALLTALEASGRLANTHIIFTSDNGYQLGEHRIDGQKDALYDESVRLPLVWFGPTSYTGGLSSVVSNIDVTAAMVSLAGATAGRTMDARDMTQLLSGDGTGWNRAALSQTRFGMGVMNVNWSYAENFNGRRELFDMSADPYQLVNVVDEPAYASAQAALVTALHALEGCAGASCSWTENFPPPP